MTPRIKHTPTTFPDMTALKDQFIACIMLVSFQFSYTKRKNSCKFWLFFFKKQRKSKMFMLYNLFCTLDGGGVALKDLVTKT